MEGSHAYSSETNKIFNALDDLVSNTIYLSNHKKSPIHLSDKIWAELKYPN